MKIQIILDIRHYFLNKKLNKGHWLTIQIYDKGRSHADIANEIGCSVKCVDKKVTKRRKNGQVSPDIIAGVRTGKFHIVTKSSLVFIFRLFKHKITDPIDELYPQIKSKNAKIFAKILLEMEQKDKDTQNSSGLKAGLSRKELYLLAGKFIIVLYEYDSYYAERMDYFLKHILEHCGTFYLDELADPENWYPNRTALLATKYFAMRNFEDNDKVIVLSANELIKKGKMKNE